MTSLAKKQKNKHKKKKDEQEKGTPGAALGGSASAAARKGGPSAGPDRDKADPRNLSEDEIKKELGNIEENIRKAAWLPPKEGGFFQKLGYVLKRVMLEMAKILDKDFGKDKKDDEHIERRSRRICRDF